MVEVGQGVAGQDGLVVPVVSMVVVEVDLVGVEVEPMGVVEAEAILVAAVETMKLVPLVVLAAEAVRIVPAVGAIVPQTRAPAMGR